MAPDYASLEPQGSVTAPQGKEAVEIPDSYYSQSHVPSTFPPRQFHFHLFYILYNHLRCSSFKKRICPPPPSPKGFKTTVLIQICFRRNSRAIKLKVLCRNLSSGQTFSPVLLAKVMLDPGELVRWLFILLSDLEFVRVPKSFLWFDTKKALAEDKKLEEDGT